MRLSVIWLALAALLLTTSTEAQQGGGNGGGAGNVTVGTTLVAGGTSNGLLYNNGGIVGNFPSVASTSIIPQPGWGSGNSLFRNGPTSSGSCNNGTPGSQFFEEYSTDGASFSQPWGYHCGAFLPTNLNWLYPNPVGLPIQDLSTHQWYGATFNYYLRSSQTSNANFFSVNGVNGSHQVTGVTYVSGTLTGYTANQCVQLVLNDSTSGATGNVYAAADGSGTLSSTPTWFAANTCSGGAGFPKAADQGTFTTGDGFGTILQAQLPVAGGALNFAQESGGIAVSYIFDSNDSVNSVHYYPAANTATRSSQTISYTKNNTTGVFSTMYDAGDNTYAQNSLTATTTLNGGINASVTSITVSATTGFPTTGSFYAYIDSEEVLDTTGSNSTTRTVTRGANGTTAASHSNGATYGASLFGRRCWDTAAASNGATIERMCLGRGFYAAGTPGALSDPGEFGIAMTNYYQQTQGGAAHLIPFTNGVLQGSGGGANAGATLQASIGNPTGTTSLTGVMMGLGSTCTITPLYSTRVAITLTGVLSNTTSTDGAEFILKWGTGTAPANQAAPTGTNAGNFVSWVMPNATSAAPFSAPAIITGLTPGTAIWFDADLFALTANTASMASLSCSAHEV